MAAAVGPEDGDGGRGAPGTAEREPGAGHELPGAAAVVADVTVSPRPC